MKYKFEPLKIISTKNTWDDILNEYKKDNKEVLSISFGLREWLKKNYHPPIKK